jgi:hypothetical protein
MAFSQSEQELLLQSGFRKIGNFFDWGETIGGVRYVAKASGMLYQLVPEGIASWSVLGRSSGPWDLPVSRTYSSRSSLQQAVPPVQFMDAVYAQFPCKFKYFPRGTGSMDPTEFLGNNMESGWYEDDQVKAAFEKRHPIDSQQVEDQEKQRIFLEWKAMKDKAFFDALFEPVKELRAQGKSDAADKLQRSIQAGLDRGVITPQTPKNRPAMDIQVRTMPLRYQLPARPKPARPKPARPKPAPPKPAPVVVVPEAPKRLRRIILEDD